MTRQLTTGNRRSPHRRALATALVGTAVLLAGCSGSGPSLPAATATIERPTPTFTRSPAETSTPEASTPEPEPTRTSSSEPSATSEAPEPTQEPTQEPTRTTEEAEPTEASEPAESSTEAAEPTTSAAPAPVAEAESDSSGVPAWVWWLLAAVLAALAVLLVVMRRRSGWADRLDAATAEVIWFARDLIPQLQQQSSAEQVAGGWHLARARVVAAEDSLTGLETSAPDPNRAEHARSLRDAVRTARDQLDAATQPGAAATVSTELIAAARTLEAALPPVDPAAGAGEGV